MSNEERSLIDQKNAAPAVMGSLHRVVKKEFTLPSGSRAVVYRGNGRNMRDAGRVADAKTEGPIGIQLAIVAQVSEVDGRTLSYNDMLDMDMDDINTLIEVVTGKGLTAVSGSSSPQTTSRN